MQQEITTRNITTCHFVPSVLTLFVANIEEIPNFCPSLEYVVCSGEALLVKDSQALVNAIPHVQVWNYYGPTEASIDVSFHLFDPAIDVYSVSIGKPVANTQLFILDENLNHVPVGVAGELYLGGIQLARGYYNRPDLTAARFIPNPFAIKAIKGSQRGDDFGSRLYATGDLCSFAPGTGDIIYIGRTDFQVKIRGFRIELAEVEIRTSLHPMVKDVVATAHTTELGMKQLVLYFTKKPSSDPDASISGDLRDYLTANLPVYMVPSHLIQMREFPLLPNGKLNRHLLPKPETISTDRRSAYSAPRNNTEQVLADVWKQVLKLESPAGIHDNFFELGGDSILSIQISSKLREHGLRVSVKQIFDFRTIAQLALHATSIVSSTQNTEQGPISGPVALSPIHHWFFSLDLQKQHHFNQAQLFTIPQGLTLPQLQTLTNHILLHHDALRLRLQKDTFTLSPDNPTSPCKIVDLRKLSSKEKVQTQLYQSNQVQESLNLESGPIAKFVLFRDETKDELLVVIHHIAVDGVSWRILLEDITTIASQLLASAPLVLPPKTSSYKSWTALLSQYSQLKPTEAEKEFKYWQKMLLNITSVPSLGLHLNRDSDTISTVETVSFELSEADTTFLLGSVCPLFHAQVNDVLLTGFALAFHSWRRQLFNTDSDSVTFLLEGHGREDIFESADVSRTVGWFTSLFPVYFYLGDLSIASTLKIIKEQLYQIPNRGIGFGMYQYLSGQPLTLPNVANEVCFNYLGQFQGSDNLFSESLTGDSNSPSNALYRLLDVNGLVRSSRLSFTISYPSRHFAKEIVQQLAQEYSSSLLSLIAHCREDPNPGGFTPGDFPLAPMPQTQLDAIVHHYTAANIEHILPLSPMQSGMLYHSLLDRHNQEYITQLKWTIQQDQRELITPSSLEQSWQTIVNRHPILRTAFYYAGHNIPPCQIVLKQATIHLEMVNVKNKEELYSWLKKDRQRGFDLTTAPLMRCSFVEVEDSTDGSVEFVWTHHHVCLDGWSVAIILGELQAFLKGTSPELLPTSVPFKEYFKWLSMQEMDKAKQFWKSYLGGIHAPTALPTPRGKKTIVTTEEDDNETAKYHLVLDKETTAKVIQVCQRYGITLFTLVQASWALLLHMYSGSYSLLFGGTFSGRSGNLGPLSFESVVGLLINTLPVRVDISPNLSIVQWLTDIQSRQAQLTQFEYTPLVKSHSWSEFPPGTPMFNSIVIFENYPSSPEGTNLMRETEAFEKTNLPLGLACQVADKCLNFILAFSKQLYSLDVVEKLGQHVSLFVDLLTNSPPGTNLDEIIVLPDEDAETLNSWNRRAVAPCTCSYLHKEIENQAEKFPDSIALVYQEQLLTYRELNSRVNQLANFLIKAGIQQEDVVGIYIERSLDMIIAYVAVIKAGAAILPLPANVPTDRLSYMISDAEAKLLLTNVDDIPNFDTNIPVFSVAKHAQYLRTLDNSNPTIPLHPSMICYMIFTSGTTGKPKGVQIPHENISARVSWWWDHLKFDRTHRISQTIALSFDPSLWEIFVPLTMGACLDLFLPGKTNDILLLRDYIAAHRITALSFTPALLNVTLDEGFFENEVTVIFLGGEKIQEAILQKLWDVFPCVHLNDNYGPTETTICATNEVYPPKSYEPEAERCIGFPVHNVSILVLSKDLHRLPVGVEGELYIAGAGQARGYKKQPALTAAAFIPLPFTRKGERFYKTGDLCRFNKAGKVIFCGRNDDQIKIRGFRVELQEIEVVLKEFEKVNHALVLAMKVGNAKQLVAYVTPELSREDIEEISAGCVTKLPEYMVPSFFISLAAFPISPTSGKIDRNALEKPQQETTSTHFPPTTTTEKILERIWCELLGLEKIGIHSNFYSLGGDSIISIQIVSRANQQGIPLTVRDMLIFPTIHKLAEVTMKRDIVQEEAPQKNIEIETFPLSPVQRFFFEDFKISNHNHFNQAYSLYLGHNELPAEQWRTIVHTLLQHHDMLRAKFHLSPDGKTWVQSIPKDIDFSLPYFAEIDLYTLSDEEQMRSIEKEMTKFQQGFDIEKGFLFKLITFNFPDESAYIVLLVHHLVMDGISSRILVEDLKRLYSWFFDYDEEILPSLPPKTNSFPQWVDAVVDYAESGALVEEEEYWKSIEKSALLLPISEEDRKKNTLESYEVATCTFKSSITSSLSELARALDTTLDRLILAGLLHAFSACKDSFFKNACKSFTIDTESHGRSDIFSKLNVTRTVGWFTTAYPMRLDLKSDLPSTTKSIRDAINAIPNKGFGYYAMKYLSNFSTHGTRTADILFNHLGIFSGADSTTEDWDFKSDVPTGSPISGGMRSHVIDINSSVTGNKLHVGFGYSTNIHTKQEIFALLMQFFNCLTTCVKSGLGTSPKVSRRNARKVTPIIMLHPVDGNVTGLTGLGVALAQPYLVLGYPEQPRNYNSLKEMAAYQLRELTKLYPRGPYIFLGYSFGALLAYEMVCQLYSKSTPDVVEYLLILDQPTFGPEDLFNRLPKTFNNAGQFLVELIENSTEVSLTKEEKTKIRNAPEDTVPSLPKHISRQLSKIQKQFIQHRLEIFSTCSNALNTYPMDPASSPLNFPIFVLTSNNNRDQPKRDLGWKEYTLANVIVKHIDADHYEMVNRDNIPKVAELINDFFSLKLTSVLPQGGSRHRRKQPRRLTGGEQEMKEKAQQQLQKLQQVPEQSEQQVQAQQQMQQQQEQEKQKQQQLQEQQKQLQEKLQQQRQLQEQEQQKQLQELQLYQQRQLQELQQQQQKQLQELKQQQQRQLQQLQQIGQQQEEASWYKVGLVGAGLLALLGGAFMYYKR